MKQFLTIVATLLLADTTVGSQSVVSKEVAAARFIALVEESAVVAYGHEDVSSGEATFTISQVWKVTPDGPKVGDTLVFKFRADREASQAAILFLPKFPQAGTFRAWKVVKGRLFMCEDLSIADLRSLAEKAAATAKSSK